MRDARLPIVGLARKSSWMAADEPPELPPTPQLAVDLNVDGQTSQRDDHCSDHQAYDIDDDLSPLVKSLITQQRRSTIRAMKYRRRAAVVCVGPVTLIK
jgi:hypothetical protein